jgi:ADP-ribose pyrophosphatase YjhB (NUDIX family)
VKPLKRSIALVIEGPRGLLLVRRPDDDESLPGLWGLPAVTLAEGESEVEAAQRAGRDKLGVEVRPLHVVGEEAAERERYRIVMRDWAVELIAGSPAVPQPGSGTQYVGWRWGEPHELVPAARAGSLCARVLLRERDLDLGSAG